MSYFDFNHHSQIINSFSYESFIEKLLKDHDMITINEKNYYDYVIAPTYKNRNSYI